MADLIRTRPCQICYSPYRKQMEKMVLKEGSTRKAVAEKYAKVMGKRVDAIYQSISKHFNNEHYKTHLVMTDGARAQESLVNLNRDYEREITFETAAKQLLQEGMEGKDELSVKEKLRLSTQLQKTNLEGKKQDLSESALKLQVAKLFGGFLQKPLQGHLDDPKEIELEAEIVEDK
mgnify:CR=1 FL=1